MYGIPISGTFGSGRDQSCLGGTIINVLDSARPPVRRSYPVRRQSALFAFFLSLGVAIAFAGFAPRGAEAQFSC